MKIILAKPRGFCAGVARAIRCVERVLELHGPPVYILNDIVHNSAVVESLRVRGAVFVRDLGEVPPGSHFLFSAHGVAPDRWEEARARDLKIVDATCPLVEKVHREARKFAKSGFSIVLIGERGHDEVVGTTGWAPDHIQVILTEANVDALHVEDPEKIVYLTQTTLSVDDCERVVAALRRRFPAIEGPPAKDICYATQNRQQAIAQLAARADIFLVVGDVASANSKRLAEICRKTGKPAYLTPAAADINEAWLEHAETILVTSGASVPESLVEGVVERLKALRPCELEECEVVHEDIRFNLPRAIAES